MLCASLCEHQPELCLVGAQRYGGIMCCFRGLTIKMGVRIGHWAVGVGDGERTEVE